MNALNRYLNPTDHNPRRITKADRNFAKKPDFQDMKFPVKIRDIHKNEEKNSIVICAFGYGNKEKHLTYVSKNIVKKNMLIYY